MSTLLALLFFITASEPLFSAAEVRGVEDVWEAKEHGKRFHIGDDMAVLTRNLDGWLNSQIKNGYFNEESFVKDYYLPAFGKFIDEGGDWAKLLRLAAAAPAQMDPKAGSADHGASLSIEEATLAKVHERFPKEPTEAVIGKARGSYNEFLRKHLAAMRLAIDRVRFEDAAPIAVEAVLSSDDRFKKWLAAGAVADGDSAYLLTYHLSRTAQSIDKWQQLIREFKFTPPVEISLVLKTSLENWIAVPTKASPQNAAPDKTQACIEFVSTWRFLTAIVLIIAALLLFSILVGPTDLLRDTDASKRPTDNAGGLAHPISLARSQMAFWFFLVAAAYLFIWLTTTRLDSLTDQVLGLIGISSATALGVAFVTSGKSPTRTVAEELKRAADMTITGAERDAAQRRADRLTAQQNRLKTCGPFMRLIDDWLTEDGAVSFHRFQMLAWTLVLGLIFVSHVVANYAMPEFSATILALMGISSGTYLGFKLPDPK